MTESMSVFFLFAMVGLCTVNALAVPKQFENHFVNAAVPAPEERLGDRWAVNGGIPEINATQHTGFITVAGTYKNGSHMFYWMIEATDVDPKTAPLLVWLTGGPGCSSILAMLTENGPMVFNDNQKLVANNYAWTRQANVLWIDNPVGSGFSHADYVQDMVTNEVEVGQQLLTFLYEFYGLFPWLKTNPLTISGESYAGHYVPAIAYAIVEANKKSRRPMRVPLASITIGNGLIDAKTQYRGYAEWARGHGITGAFQNAALDALAATCTACLDILGNNPVCLIDCQVYMSTVMEIVSADLGYQINPYNYKIACKVPPLCYDFSGVSTFLNEAAVQQHIGVKVGYAWSPCNMEVHSLLMNDWLSNLALHLPEVIADGIRVVVYDGLLDFICNSYGESDALTALPWPGQQQWQSTPMTPLMQNGKKVGTIKNVGLLWSLDIEDAGHMAPRDQPEVMYNVINDVLKNTLK